MDTSNVAILVEDHATKAKAFLEEASVTKSQQTYDKAIEEYVSAVKHALLLNSDKSTQRLCMFNLGATYIAAGKYARGIDVLEKLLKESQKVSAANQSAVPLHGDILFNIAYGFEQTNKFDKALAFYEDALVHYKELEDAKPMLCETLINMANVYAKTRNVDQAITYYSKAAESYADDSRLLQSCYALIHQSRLMLSLRSISDEECLKVLQSCLSQSIKISSIQSKCDVLNELGLIYTLVNSMENSIFCFQTILAELENLAAIGEKTNGRTASTLQNLAAVYNSIRDYENAINCTHEAVDMFGKLGRRKSQGQCFCAMAFAQSQMGMYDGARESFLCALQAFKDSSDNAGQWQAHEGLAAICVIKESYETSIQHYQLAIRLQADSSNSNAEDQDRLVRKLSQAILLHLGEKRNEENPDKKPIQRPKTAGRPTSAKLKTHVEMPEAVVSKKTPRRTNKRVTTSTPKTEVDKGRRTYNEGENQPVIRNRPSSRGLSRASTNLSRTISDMEKIQVEPSKDRRKWYHKIPFMDDADESEIEISRRSVEELIPGSTDVIYSNIQSPGIRIGDESENDNLKTISEASDVDTARSTLEVEAEVHGHTPPTSDTSRENATKSDGDDDSSDAESDFTVVSDDDETDPTYDEVAPEYTEIRAEVVMQDTKPLVVAKSAASAPPIVSITAAEEYVETDEEEEEVDEDIVSDEEDEVPVSSRGIAHSVDVMDVEEEVVIQPASVADTITDDAEEVLVEIAPDKIAVVHTVVAEKQFMPPAVPKFSAAAPEEMVDAEEEEEAVEPIEMVTKSVAHSAQLVDEASSDKEEVEDSVAHNVDVSEDEEEDSSSYTSSDEETSSASSSPSVVEVTPVKSAAIVDAATRSEDNTLTKTTPVKPPRSILSPRSSAGRSVESASDEPVYHEISSTSEKTIRFTTPEPGQKVSETNKQSDAPAKEEIAEDDVKELSNVSISLDMEPVNEEMIEPIVIHHYGDGSSSSSSSSSSSDEEVEKPAAAAVTTAAEPVTAQTASSSTSTPTENKTENYLILPSKTSPNGSRKNNDKSNKPSKLCIVM